MRSDARSFYCTKTAFLQDVIYKTLQNNTKKVKFLQNICIYKKNVLSLQRISEESRNAPQKVNQ